MSVTINIRISKEEKKRLAKVARDSGLTLSAFLRHAAIKESHRVLGPPKSIRHPDWRSGNSSER